MVRFAQLAKTLVFAASLGGCLAALAETPESSINRQIRARIRADIKAHGQAFDGPGHVPSNLLKAIEGKRLVGLGEGSHGTSEIQSFYGNLILAMAKKGRVLFFLEDFFAGVAAVNGWCLGDGGDADLAIAMSGLYSIHKTQEFASFFREVRKFNTTAPSWGRLEIYGIDTVLGSGPNDVTPALQAFNTTNGLNLDAQITTCASYINDPKAQNPKSRVACVGAAAQIQLAISGIDSRKSGQAEAAVMANVLVHYIQQEQAYNNVFSSIQVGRTLGDSPTSTISDGIRDAGMAENIKILLDAKLPSSGTGVYWAHNAHVGRISMLDADPTGFPSTWGNAGCILNLWLGDSYFSLGAIIGKGTYRGRVIDARGGTSASIQEVRSPSSLHPDSLNALATAVCTKPVFFLTKQVPLLSSTRPEYYVSFAAEPDHPYVLTVPGMAYTGVISFPLSSAAHEMK